MFKVKKSKERHTALARLQQEHGYRRKKCSTHLLPSDCVGGGGILTPRVRVSVESIDLDFDIDIDLDPNLDVDPDFNLDSDSRTWIPAI